MLDEQETTMMLRMVQKARHMGLEQEINEPMKELSEETHVTVSQSLDEKSH